MNEDTLKALLNEVKEKDISIDEALLKLKNFEYKELGFAKVDNHRTLRTGYPEVIFCQGKTPGQVAEIIGYMKTQGHNILGTRATPETYEKVKEICPEAIYHELARTITVQVNEIEKSETHIGILTAGTSDIPVAEEAAITAEIFGNSVERYYDVGVAGIHRFYNHMHEIRKAKVLGS